MKMPMNAPSHRVAEHLDVVASRRRGCPPAACEPSERMVKPLDDVPPAGLLSRLMRRQAGVGAGGGGVGDDDAGVGGEA